MKHITKPLLTFISVLTFIALLEIILVLLWGKASEKLWVYEHRNQYYLYNEVIANKPIFKKIYTEGEYWYVHNRYSREGEKAFRYKKKDNEVRVFIVGESAAGVLCLKNKAETLPFEQQLININREKSDINAILSKRFPGRTINIVCCGFEGYTTARLLPVIREIANHQPDLVLFLSGNRIIPEPSYLCRLMSNPPPFSKLYLYSWTYRLAADYIYSFPDNGDFDIPQWFFYYEKIASTLAKQKIPTILFSLPQNYLDRAPHRYYDRLDISLLRAMLEKGIYKEITALESENLSSVDPSFWYIIGQAYWELKDKKKAESALKLSLDFDTSNARTCTIRNHYIRQLASKYGHILLDGEALIDDLLENQLPGMNYFRDDCHWHYYINFLLMDRLVRVINNHAVCGIPPVSVDLFFPEYTDEEIQKLVSNGYESLTKRSRLFSQIYHSITGHRENAIAQMRITLRTHPDILLRIVEKEISEIRKLKHPWFANNEDIEKNWYRFALNAAEAARLEGLNDLSDRFLDCGKRCNAPESSLHFPYFLSNMAKGEYNAAEKDFFKATAQDGFTGDIEATFNNIVKIYKGSQPTSGEL